MTTPGAAEPVNAGGQGGVLNAGRDNSLVKELQQAITLINEGKSAGAIQNLIIEAQDLENSGTVSASQAGPLISEAKLAVSEL